MMKSLPAHPDLRNSMFYETDLVKSLSVFLYPEYYVSTVKSYHFYDS
ncbi:hypothetical protein [Pedobacter endophyticus]|uniref:Uncharacterized protein n=1 Tax=Pedobacter endophyticus TaxID=2789740 RepID=A0A7S9Q047_9SPHI|nr:hypothetical protein [Pedobacter endophyticus]QPH40356.1 hypothetical protein IZT61_03490 [Pedobacter endophyticus]